MSPARAQFEHRLRLARALGHIAHRGVLQHFFVSPILPLKPLNLQHISESWRELVAAIGEGRAEELLTLYFHIPFCTHKCRYCIYHSIGDFAPADLEGYLDRLHAEIDHFAPIFDGVRFATNYIGGGTPTVLSEDQLERLLAQIDGAFARRRGGEWAFECNPLTITEGKAALFERYGYNRVSFGVQTVNPRVLDGVNRGYQTMDRLVTAFRLLHARKFWINVDLIHGLPGDSLESVEHSLRTLLEFEPTQVTIYALSPYTPIQVDPAEAMPLDELAGALELVARPFGYRVGHHATCIDVTNPDRGRNRLTDEHRRAGESYPYDDTTVEPFSLLGLGPTARCYIYSQMVYTFRTYDVTEPFDTGVEIARGRPVTMMEERRRFVVHRLGTPAGLALADYERRFGEKFTDAFAQELESLQGLGMLAVDCGVARHTTGDAVERFAVELFFVDQAMLDAAARDAAPAGNEPASSGGRPEESLGIALETPDLELRLVLAAYWPGRPCFHHARDFAFYIPSELPEGTCSHTELEERLLSAFARLFDRVVEADAPASLTELHRSLLERGSQLRLKIRTPSGTEQIAVRLSSWE